MLCCAVLCCAVLCCAVLCCAVLCCIAINSLLGIYSVKWIVQMERQCHGMQWRQCPCKAFFQVKYTKELDTINQSTSMCNVFIPNATCMWNYIEACSPISKLNADYPMLKQVPCTACARGECVCTSKVGSPSNLAVRAPSAKAHQ